MRDITLEETVYFNFTTRAFSSGVPTTLSGTPALSVLESNNATPITSGVSVSVDRASVTGLNQATVVATAANGYEAGKSYAVYISTGTVGGVSVVGEVVAQFTIQAGAAFTRLGAPAGASVSADVAAVKTQTAAIETDTQDIQTRLPAALVSGRIDASVGAMAAGVLTATAIAADAITDAKVASDVTIASVTGAVGSVTGAVGSVTGNVGGNVVGSVGSVTAAVTVGALQAAAIADLFDTNSGTTYASAVAGSVVKEIADNAGGSGLTAGAIADAVWDEILSGHVVSGSTGEALSAAGGAGDPWITALPGSYSAGQAGYILGTNLNATVSSRLASASYTAPLDAAGTRTAVGLASANLDTQLAAAATVGASAIRSAVGLASANLDTQLSAIDDFLDTEIAAIKAKTDNLPASPAATGDIPSAATIADAVHDEVVEGTTTLRQSIRLANAVLGGKASGLDTTSAVYRDIDDTKDRVAATVDANGNRTAVTRDLT